MDRVKVFPLAERRSLSQLSDALIDPTSAAPPVDSSLAQAIKSCAAGIRAARTRKASVILIYGAHLVKNGLGLVAKSLINDGWITHLATNGAGAIHDWEFAFMGKSEESVRENVAKGCFGTWDETGRFTNLALMTGLLRGEGYGRSLGRLIVENGLTLPTAADLEALIKNKPVHPLTGARADLLQAIRQHQLPTGKLPVRHPHQDSSILAAAFTKGIPLTIHPGIGYDIIVTHPIYNGASIGRSGQIDFAQFGAAVDQLDGGVVINIGSAVMGPQIFEKSLSCVNNLRLQQGRKIVAGHTIHLVDIQNGGDWDWTHGEPPKDNPAYYLRFCKSFARMGGETAYYQCDNRSFLQNLQWVLRSMG